MWLAQGTVRPVGNYEEVLMNLKTFRGNKLIMEEEGTLDRAPSILMGQLYILLLARRALRKTGPTCCIFVCIPGDP